MKREDFVEGMKKCVWLTEEEMDDIEEMSIGVCSKEMKLVVIIEELAELQQQLSKQIRGEGNYYDLLQEMADVYISMDFLCKHFNVSKEEASLAKSVKLMRERDRRNKK